MELDLFVRIFAESSHTLKDADPVDVSALSDVLNFESFKFFVVGKGITGIVDESIVDLALLNGKNPERGRVNLDDVEESVFHFFKFESKEDELEFDETLVGGHLGEDSVEHVFGEELHIMD